MRVTVAAAAVVALLAVAGCRDDAVEPEAEPTPSLASEPSATATTDPAALGFDAQVLDGLAKQAETSGSTCLLVARHGEVAGEWYWGDGSPTVPRHSGM